MRKKRNLGGWGYVQSMGNQKRLEIDVKKKRENLLESKNNGRKDDISEKGKMITQKKEKKKTINYENAMQKIKAEN